MIKSKSRREWYDVGRECTENIANVISGVHILMKGKKIGN